MKLGCDPEIFLVDASGAFISAIEKIGGSKSAPRPLEELGEGYNVQEDNVAIEFGVPPAESKQQWINSIKTIREYLSNLVYREYLCTLSSASAANFSDSELQHPAALEFGCDPDFNAWTGRRNPRPKATDQSLRSCGGHIHVGHTFASPKEAKDFIKFMDLCAGVPSVILDDGAKRKELYGKHGAFRIKPYGVEYRTLSNFWIFDDARLGWAWDATSQAMDAWQNKTINVDELHDEIAHAIDNNDKSVAMKLVNQYNLQLV